MKRSKVFEVKSENLREALSELPSFLDQFCEDERNLFLVLVFKKDLNWRGISCDLDFLRKSHEVGLLLKRIPGITIAVVEGSLFNSAFELLFFFDLVYAKPGLYFGFDSDFLPVFGGIKAMVDLVGVSLAKRILFMGEVDSDFLKKVGIINSVFDDPMEAAEKFVEKASERSPLALKLSKEILEASRGLSLEAGLALEREMFAYCFTAPDRIEGIRAFLEKRKPNFEGGRP